MPTWHGHPTLGSFEPSQPLGWEDICPRQISVQDNSCILGKIKERFEGLPHLVETLHYLEHAATKKPLFRLIFPTRELAIEAASKMNKTPIGNPHSCTVGENDQPMGVTHRSLRG